MMPLGLFLNNAIGFQKTGSDAGGSGGNKTSSTHYLEFDGSNRAYQWSDATATSTSMAGKSEVTIEVEVYQTQRESAAGFVFPTGNFFHIGYDDGGTDFFFLDWGNRIHMTQSLLDGTTTGTVSKSGTQNQEDLEVQVNSANWDTARYVASTHGSPNWLKIALVCSSSGGIDRKTVYLYDPELEELVFECYSEGAMVNNTPGAIDSIFRIGGRPNGSMGHTGGLSFIRMWDKSCTKSEVLDHFQNGINQTDPDLVFNISLDEGTGAPSDIINDVAGSAVSGAAGATWRVR
jgi:hypothetical protein